MLVFLSHSSKDRRFVEQKLIPFLQSQGVKAWYSTVDIRTADDWERSIREALQSCDSFLVILSPNSVNSEWVRAEVHWAMENRKGRVIPVLVADCNPFQLHLKLALIEHVDLHEDCQTAWEKLAAVWNKASNGQQTQQTTGRESGCRVGDHHPWTPRTVRLGLRFNVLDQEGSGIVFTKKFIDILSKHCVKAPPSDLDELRRTLLLSILDTTPVKITMEELAEFAGVARAHLLDLVLEISTQSQVLLLEDSAYSVSSALEDELLDSLAEKPPPKKRFRESVLQLFCEMSRARLLLYADEHAAKSGLVGGFAFIIWRGHDRIDVLAEALSPNSRQPTRQQGIRKRTRSDAGRRTKR